MNIQKLKGKIIERGISVEVLSKMIGITKSAMYRKLNAFDKITVGEVKRIKEALQLTDEEACDIFLR